MPTATDTAEAFAAALAEAILHCRAFGHQWEPQSVEHKRKQRVYHWRWLCSSCTSEKMMVVNDRTGETADNRYDYVDGFLATGMEPGTMRRSVFRMEVIHRMEHATRSRSRVKRAS